MLTFLHVQQQRGKGQGRMCGKYNAQSKSNTYKVYENSLDEFYNLWNKEKVKIINKQNESITWTKWYYPWLET